MNILRNESAVTFAGPARFNGKESYMKDTGFLFKYFAFAVVFSLLYTTTQANESFKGFWQGVITRSNSQALITIEIQRSVNGFQGTMSMESVAMFRQKLTNVSIENDGVHFEQDNIGAVFNGNLSGDSISGTLSIIGMGANFFLKRSGAISLPYVEEDVIFFNDTVALSGTLVIPNTKGLHTAVVFTHGGGPDTRDASRFYADYLARRGIASLIYDKRGVGKSALGSDWGRSGIDDLAGDAIAAVTYLKKREGINSKAIGLYGPSNGGWVIEHAAARSKDIAFLVVVSGGGIPLWQSETFRVEAETKAEKFDDKDVKKAVDFMKQKFEVAKTGNNWDQFKILIDSSRKEKWFPYVLAPRSSQRLQEAWKGMFSYDPTADLRKLRIPVLAFFGALDTETPAKAIAKKTAASLKAAGNKNFKIVLYPNATHSLLILPDEKQGGQLFHLPEDFMSVMTNWIKNKSK